MEANTGFAGLVGQEVEVYTNGGGQTYTDTGTIVGFDDPWLMLRTKKGALFCYPIHNVRLVKVERAHGDTHLAALDEGGQG